MIWLPVLLGLLIYYPTVAAATDFRVSMSGFVFSPPGIGVVVEFTPAPGNEHIIRALWSTLLRPGKLEPHPDVTVQVTPPGGASVPLPFRYHLISGFHRGYREGVRGDIVIKDVGRTKVVVHFNWRIVRDLLAARAGRVLISLESSHGAPSEIIEVEIVLDLGAVKLPSTPDPETESR